MNQQDTKRCTKCLETLSLANFSQAKKGKFGVASWCRNCCNVYRKSLFNLPASEKTCPKCGQLKQAKEFYLLRTAKDGLYPCCRLCLKEVRKLLYARPKGKIQRKEAARKFKLRRKFGITEEQFNLMVAEQNNRCAICGTSEPGGNANKWHIDHDHQTNRVRKLLCAKCNMGIGHLNDDPAIIAQSFFYLTSFSEIPVVM